MSYFWLNNAQLNKAKDENYWQKVTVKGRVLYQLEINSNGDALNFASKNESARCVSEIRNLYYLLKENQSTSKLKQGAFLFDHY